MHTSKNNQNPKLYVIHNVDEVSNCYNVTPEQLAAIAEAMEMWLNRHRSINIVWTVVVGDMMTTTYSRHVSNKEEEYIDDCIGEAWDFVDAIAPYEK